MSNIVKAIATFLPTKNSDISGVITFEQNSYENHTTIYGYINGLKPGKHGIHIHTFGDLSGGCITVGDHFNPYKKNHGSAFSRERHLGDLGNIECTNEYVPTYFHLKNVDLSIVGPFSIIGRALVIHADPDDLGMTNHPLSKTTGNSGFRLACAVIGIKDSN
jgi:superoxide dismutase, Cu-Zn family